MLLKFIYRCKSAMSLLECLDFEASERGFEEEIFVTIMDILPELQTTKE